MMELKETIEMMQSADYKERFKAEYFQLNNRIGKLEAMLDKWSRDELNFVPSNPYDLLKAQLEAMKAYQYILQVRATNENVDLSLAAVE